MGDRIRKIRGEKTYLFRGLVWVERWTDGYYEHREIMSNGRRHTVTLDMSDLPNVMG